MPKEAAPVILKTLLCQECFKLSRLGRAQESRSHKDLSKVQVSMYTKKVKRVVMNTQKAFLAYEMLRAILFAGLVSDFGGWSCSWSPGFKIDDAAQPPRQRRLPPAKSISATQLGRLPATSFHIWSLLDTRL